MKTFSSDYTKNDPTQDFVPEDSPSDLKRKEAIKGYYQDAWNKKQAGLDGDIDKAKSMQEVAGYGDIAGNILTNYANSQKSPVILANRLQDLGKPNETIQPTEQKWNSLAPAADKNLAQARTAKDDAYKGLKQSSELQQLDTDISDKNVARDRTNMQYDKTSDVSKMAQVLARASIDSKAREAEAAGDKGAAASLRAIDTSGMTAQEAKSFADSMKGTDYKDVIKSQDERSKNAALVNTQANALAEDKRHHIVTEDNTAELNAAKSVNTKLPSVEQQKLNANTGMGLKAVRDMRTALDAGQNTFSMIGDNDFTESQRRAAEAFGRLQSGGAINKDEEVRFIAMGPKSTDSKEMQHRKLANQEAEYIARMKSAGINPEQEVANRATDGASQDVGSAIEAEKARRAAIRK